MRAITVRVPICDAMGESAHILHEAPVSVRQANPGTSATAALRRRRYVMTVKKKTKRFVYMQLLTLLGGSSQPNEIRPF